MNRPAFTHHCDVPFGTRQNWMCEICWKQWWVNGCSAGSEPDQPVGVIASVTMLYPNGTEEVIPVLDNKILKALVGGDTNNEND